MALLFADPSEHTRPNHMPKAFTCYVGKHSENIFCGTGNRLDLLKTKHQGVERAANRLVASTEHPF